MSMPKISLKWDLSITLNGGLGAGNGKAVVL